jgi:hypothetical protein
MNPFWEFKTIGLLVEHVAVPLLGLVLVFYGEADFRSKWERPILMFLSWACLLSAVIFLLLAPLLVVDSLRINDQINAQINTQVSQQLSVFERLEKQLDRATTAQDIDNVIARLNIQGLPANISNPQELKSRLLSEIAKAKQTIRPQAEAAATDKRLTQQKDSIKWLLGTLVSGFAFAYIWYVTPWARRGRRRSRR